MWTVRLMCYLCGHFWNHVNFVDLWGPMWSFLDFLTYVVFLDLGLCRPMIYVDLCRPLHLYRPLWTYVDFCGTFLSLNLIVKDIKTYTIYLTIPHSQILSWSLIDFQWTVMVIILIHIHMCVRRNRDFFLIFCPFHAVHICQKPTTFQKKEVCGWFEQMPNVKCMGKHYPLKCF